MKAALLIAVIAAALALTCAAPAALADDPSPPSFDPKILGFDVGLVDPFADGYPSYGALMLPVQVVSIPEPDSITSENFWRTVPQYMLARSTLEIVAPFDLDDIDLGVSVRAFTVSSEIPIRLGLNHTEAGWGWHFSSPIWRF